MVGTDDNKRPMDIPNRMKVQWSFGKSFSKVGLDFSLLLESILSIRKDVVMFSGVVSFRLHKPISLETRYREMETKVIIEDNEEKRTVRLYGAMMAEEQ